VSVIGKPVPRVDGRAKVTGAAHYAADFRLDRMSYAALVQSTIAKGCIVAIDIADAAHAPGVLAVLTHENAPRIGEIPETPPVDAQAGTPERPLQSDRVLHQGQHIAAVVAETLEQARFAATLIRVSYQAEPATIAMDAALSNARPATEEELGANLAEMERGDAGPALASAAVSVDSISVIERQTHNPIELHATTAFWERDADGDRLTVYDKTQWVQGCAKHLGSAFDLPPERVHVIDPFIGGAFGSSLRVWPHTYIAAMAAKVVGRPVKLVLSRREYYGGTGARPWTRQRVQIGADRDGTLKAIRHEVVAENSSYEIYTENTLKATPILYRCPNVSLAYDVAPRDVNSVNAMRAPGLCTGVYALELAMDELAVCLGIDPVALRLRNLPERDQMKNLPFSSISLARCYAQAAEKFGWSKRDPRPGSMTDGRLLLGWGMATANYPAEQMKATATARVTDAGAIEVATASADMGPGTYTSLTQVAAETLGVSVQDVHLSIGDSSLPMAPVHGGSMTMSSVGPAIRDACEKLRRTVYHAAAVNDGRIDDIAKRLNRGFEARGEHDPGDLAKRFSTEGFGAVFAEVAVDPNTSEIRVRRLTGAYGIGRVVNPMLARSQAIGGMMGGIGMALLEQTEIDRRSGRFVNANLAEYLVPCMADTPALDVTFVTEEDSNIGGLGTKGLGEIALVGVAPAIANAIFHATGKRLRHLPMTPDRLAKE
jgi:xanthine dehydrogenase YagR molybdenum-binding subunit